MLWRFILIYHSYTRNQKSKPLCTLMVGWFQLFVILNCFQKPMTIQLWRTQTCSLYTLYSTSSKKNSNVVVFHCLNFWKGKLMNYAYLPSKRLNFHVYFLILCWAIQGNDRWDQFQNRSLWTDIDGKLVAF
jgi:hypothetical protein